MTALDSARRDHPGLLRFAGGFLIGVAVLAVAAAHPWSGVEAVTVLVAFAAAVLVRGGARLLAGRDGSVADGLSLYRLLVVAAIALLCKELIDPSAVRWSVAHALWIAAALTGFWTAWIVLQSLRQLEDARREPTID